MSERLTTEQKQLITTYRQQFAELKSYSDEQILSIINNAASEIKLSEDEQVSILHNSAQGSTLGGLALETKLEELTKEEETQLLDILGSRIDSVTAKTEEAENKNGFLGKAWNWTKNNLLDWCTDSTNDIKKAQKEELEALKSGDIKTAFEKITGEEYNPENANKFLNNELKTKSEQALEGYEEGQEMAADFAGDMISGIAAIGIYSASLAAAPFTGGLSIAVGLADAAVVAGLIKSGIKAWDASSAKREYNTFGKDMITGGFSGLLAPFTGGVGGAVGRGVAAKLGIQAVKQAGKEVLETGGKQTLRTMLQNPLGYEYLGKRAFLALGAEMAADGALGGAIDGTFREGYEEIEKDGELSVGNLLSAFLQGGIFGFALSPAIGGGFKGMGKLISKLFGKNAVVSTPVQDKFVNPDEVWTPKKTAKGTADAVSDEVFKPRFTKEEINKIIETSSTQFVKENEAVVREFLESIPDNVGILFEDYVYEILSVLDNKNIGIAKKLILNYEGNILLHSIEPMLRNFSKIDISLSEKLIDIFIKKKGFPLSQKVADITSALQKYPEAQKFLLGDVNVEATYYRLSDFLLDAKALEELCETIAKTDKQKNGLLTSLWNDTNFSIDMMKKFVNADISLNNKQFMTFAKNCGYELDETLSKLQSVKGKTYSADKEAAYTKVEICEAGEQMNFLKTLDLNEEEMSVCLNNKYMQVIMHLIKFGEDTGVSLFGATPADVVKYAVEAISNGDKEVLKRFEMFTSIARYCTKENYEKFSKTCENATPEMFVNDILSNSINIECKSICNSVIKHTGKTIYEQDLIVLGPNVLHLTSLADEEVSSAIKVLKELDLIKDDSNILTMLTMTKELNNIKITPEIKEFAKFLSSNENMEESILIDILHSAQGNSTEITLSKINYVKELLAKTEPRHYIGISGLLDKLSSTNTQILKSQLDIISLIDPQDTYNLDSVARALNSDNIEEYNLYAKLVKRGIKSNFMYLSRVLSDTKLSKQKYDVAQFIDKLLDKNVEFSEIVKMIEMLSQNNLDVLPQFMKQYIKGLDVDLGELKDSYTELVLLHVSDLNSLNIKSKLEIYEKITALDDNAKAIMEKAGLDYDNLYNKIVDSLGSKRPIVDLPENQSKLFAKQIIANNNPSAEKILKEFDFSQFGKEGLPLKYSRDKFNANVKELLKDLSEDEVFIILKHFGLEKGEAGFDGIPNDRVFDNAKVSAEAHEAAIKIQKEIEDFTLNNEVKINNPEVKEVLDGLIKGLPEFTSIVGKKQHGTHAYSVDIHTLKVLQSAMNDPLYKELSDADKTVLKYSILLHDLGKKGGVVDSGHASLSADYTWAILDRTSLPATTQDRIIDIVDNHHWFEKYNTGRCSAEDVAVRCRRESDMKIYEIFSKADFENVNENFHLGSKSGGSRTQAEFDKYMKEKMTDIENAVKRIYQKANYIFDTQFMHDGKLFPTQKVEIDGEITNLKVLNLSELDDGKNLAKYGFAPNVTKENARFLVHMTDPNFASMETVYRLTSNPLYESTWSASLIKESNNRTYGNKKFGFIFDSPQANISEAFFANTGSGYSKGLSAFKNFLFGSRKIEYNGQVYDVRHFVKNNFIEEMHLKGYDLTDEEYAELTKLVFDRKYTTQFNNDIKIGDKVIKVQDFVDAMETSRDRLFDGGNIHSEIVPFTPRVKGLVAKVEKLEDCPSEFLKFAKEHNLPIILMKPAKNEW